MNSNKRQNTQNRFIRHLATYVGVNLLLLIVDISDGGNWWFFYPLIGWGIVLGLEGLRTFRVL